MFTDQDGRPYLGPLVLWCTTCEEERETRVGLTDDPIEVRVEGMTMTARMMGQRHCLVCNGTRLGLRYFKAEFTVDQSCLLDEKGALI